MPGNVDFIAELYRCATLPAENFLTRTVQGRVSDVFHRDGPRAAGVAYYENNLSVVAFAYYDYAILAMPHDATAAIVSRLGYDTRALTIRTSEISEDPPAQARA